jgi:hypothetical protein
VILAVNKMNKAIKIIDPSKDHRWDTFIADDHRSSIYHSSVWKEIVQSSFDYQPLFFVLEDTFGDICGGMPFFLLKSWLTGTRLVSLSFSDHCDVLLRDNKDLGLILNAVIEQSKRLGASTIEVRTKNESVNFEDFNFIKSACYKNHIVTLDEPLDVIRKKIHKRYRTYINSAQRSGLTLEFGTCEKDMKSYYNLYVMMRKHHGLLPEPYRFFKNVWQYLYPRNMLSLILAKEGSKPIAGIIILKFKDYSHVLSNASDRNYLTKRPNHLLWWKGVELAHKEGFRYYDLGRTSLNNKGLLDFKRYWGAFEYDITHYSHGSSTSNSLLQNIKNSESEFVHSLLRLMPNGILKFGGNLLYRHLH